MKRLKESLRRYAAQPGFKKKTILMLTGVLLMGFFMSFLIEVDLGTDPCTFMNVTIAGRLHILFGSWQLLMNALLLVLVIWLKPALIGLGTIGNMVLIGYTSDFCRYLWAKWIPRQAFTDFPARGILFALALVGFVFAASLYMNADMGLAPYDGVPVIVHEHLLPKVPFTYVRMAFDFTVILIGVLFRGRPNIGIILMALLLGPTVGAVGKMIHKTGIA